MRSADVPVGIRGGVVDIPGEQTVDRVIVRVAAEIRRPGKAPQLSHH